EGDAGAERHLRADDAVAAIKALLDAEHVHRAALAFRIAALAPGELGHDAARIHLAGEHVAVVAIGGDDGIAGLQRRLHADDDGLLADVEVAEAADEAHAVKLSRALLEAADRQHGAVVARELVVRGRRARGRNLPRAVARGALLARRRGRPLRGFGLGRAFGHAQLPRLEMPFGSAPF